MTIKDFFAPKTAPDTPRDWWDDKQTADSVLARYDAVRKKVRELVPVIQKKVGKPEMNQSGRDLGLLRRGIFCFDSEEHSAVWMDYLLFFSRMHGTTACERYLKSLDRSHEDDLMRAARDALGTARYTFLVLDEPRPGFGYVCHDVLLGKRVFLVDRGMSQTPAHAVSLATAIFQVDNWVMTTGAALPLSANSVDEATQIVRGVFEELKIVFRMPVNPSGKDQARLARVFIRAITAAGGLDHIQYEEGQRQA